MSPKKRGKGTAAKSLTLTYAQLAFLDEKPNASEWVRGAVDQAMRIEAGELTVAKPPPPGFGETFEGRLVKVAQKWRSDRLRLGYIIETIMDLEEAADAEDAKTWHYEVSVPCGEVSARLREILKASRERQAAARAP